MRRCFDKAVALPAREMLILGRQHDLDGRATLSLCRQKQFFDQQIGDLLAVVAICDYQHIDRRNESAGSYRGPEPEYGTTRQLPVRLDERNARIGQVDQLAEQTDRVHRRVAARHGTSFRAKRVQPIYVGYASLPDQVLH